MGVAGEGVGVAGFGVEGLGETNGFFVEDVEDVDDFFFGLGVAAKPVAPKASAMRSAVMEVRHIVSD